MKRISVVLNFWKINEYANVFSWQLLMSLLEDYLAKEIVSYNDIPINDKRGQKEPSNKTSKESSHYSRSESPYLKYLQEGLNSQMLYKLYCDKCAEQNKISVKDSFYRNIFSTKFKLSFRRPQLDTCDTCNILNNLIKNSTTEVVVAEAKEKIILHLKKAAAV